MTTLQVRIGGTGGPAVVLLHGIPGSSESWSKVLSRIDQRVQTIVPDLLGFGGSPDAPADGHAAEQAAAVALTLKRHRLDNVHLVGFDFGGPVAILLYRQNPAIVRSITVAATNLFTDTPIPAPLLTARVPLLGEWTFRAMFGAAGLSAMWAMAVANKNELGRDEFLRAVGGGRERAAARGIFLYSLRNLKRAYGEIEQTLPEIAVPASVVWGDRDPFFPLAVGTRTANAIAGSRLHVLTRCGHFIPGEKPEEFAAIIEGTVARGETYSSSSKMAKSC
ncbi:MAG TPA: alpha/beta hydrolase [Thermoanaerobaculia bacterium]|nr:alpha/beta hydrolase [Thermoanaerobaculia bacterium]